MHLPVQEILTARRPVRWRVRDLVVEKASRAFFASSSISFRLSGLVALQNQPLAIHNDPTGDGAQCNADQQRPQAELESAG
jgi:hypothetical protein